MLKQMHHRVAALTAADMGLGSNMKTPSYQEQIFPPWSHGKNNPAIDKGLEFTVPEVDKPPLNYQIDLVKKYKYYADFYIEPY